MLLFCFFGLETITEVKGLTTSRIGVCRCSKNFRGEHCEERVDASGSFSFLMFLLMVALVAAGIGLLYQRKRIQEEIKKVT